MGKCRHHIIAKQRPVIFLSQSPAVRQQWCPSNHRKYISQQPEKKLHSHLKNISQQPEKYFTAAWKKILQQPGKYFTATWIFFSHLTFAWRSTIFFGLLLLHKMFESRKGKHSLCHEETCGQAGYHSCRRFAGPGKYKVCHWNVNWDNNYESLTMKICLQDNWGTVSFWCFHCKL